MTTEAGLPREPAALPSGTVTFVFTDIEGSTQRWDRHRAAMEQAVRRHDAILRSAIDAYGGHVFKTMGDAFCAAFARPENAVPAILDAQRAIAAEDFSSIDGLRVRAAIHTGTADERDGDYFGPAVNRVARLLAIGHGGQVLVSGVTTDLVQGDLPPKTSLRDLGDHRLRDLSRPERVYQLVAPDLVADFPPLHSLDVLPNNLPRMVKSFVGREAEIAEITALVEAAPLVTLVGAGGVGKTRTSLQVAANLLDGSGDGVWFIELAPLTSGEYIPTAVVQALGLTLATEGDPVENLVRALKRKRALLVFDNCEHMVDPVAHIISQILRDCPNIKIIASSRQGLGIDGEETYRVPSLEVPAEGDSEHVAAAVAIRYAAVALFVDRALTVDKKFKLTDENATVITDICRRLDGIPLAIELAASRVKMLSPAQLRDRLNERFRVLTGGSRDVLPRQQTLRALIDWSHDLLDVRERVLFRRLGIFVKGFTLEGAIAVGSSEDLDESGVFDVLASLLDKSLVVAEPHGDAVRYRLLESTRAYASEKLDDASERDLVAGRHLRYFRDRFTELWKRHDRGASIADLAMALQTDLEDVRAALEHALTHSQVLDGAELLANVDNRFGAIGLDAEGTARCEAYLAALPPAESRLRARLSIALSYFLGQWGHKLRALELANEAVEYARASGDGSLLARALARYAQRATALGALDDADRALTQAEAIPGTSNFLRIHLLEARAFFTQSRGDFDAAARMYEQLRRDWAGTNREHIATLCLAEIAHAQGQTPRAITLVREALPSLRAGRDRFLLANTLTNLVGYLVASHDPLGAVAAAREAIAIYSTSELDHNIVAIAIEHLAVVFALRADFTRAATLEGYADAAFGRHGFEREFTETTAHDRLCALLGEGLAPEELARLSAAGAALPPEAAIALAFEAHEPA